MVSSPFILSRSLARSLTYSLQPPKYGYDNLHIPAAHQNNTKRKSTINRKLANGFDVKYNSVFGGMCISFPSFFILNSPITRSGFVFTCYRVAFILSNQTKRRLWVLSHFSYSFNYQSLEFEWWWIFYSTWWLYVQVFFFLNPICIQRRHCCIHYCCEKFKWPIFFVKFKKVKHTTLI